MMSCLWILVFGSLIAMQGGKVAASEDDGADVTPAPAEDPDPDSAPSEDGSTEAGTPAPAEDTASEEAATTTETPSSETEGQQSDPEPTDSDPDSAADPPTTEEPQTDPPVTPADDSADDETDPPATPADDSVDPETDPPVTPENDSVDPETDPPVTPADDSADAETDPPVIPADDSADDETEAPETDDTVDEPVVTEEGGLSVHGEGRAGSELDLLDALDTKTQAEPDQPTGDKDAVHSAGAKAAPNDGNESKGSGSGTVAGVVASFGVAIIGAVTGYFAYLKKKLCFKAQGRDPERAKEENGAQNDPQVLSNLLNSS